MREERNQLDKERYNLMRKEKFGIAQIIQITFSIIMLVVLYIVFPQYRESALIVTGYCALIIGILVFIAYKLFK